MHFKIIYYHLLNDNGQTYNLSMIYNNHNNINLYLETLIFVNITPVNQNIINYLPKAGVAQNVIKIAF